MGAMFAVAASLATAFAVGGFLVGRSSRLPWLALAVASIPLTTVLWWNVGEAGQLLDGATVRPPSADQLKLKLGTITGGVLAPALAAWAIMWHTPDDARRPCPRLCLQPWQRAGRAAAATVGVLVLAGAALFLLDSVAGQRTAIGGGHWAAVDPWLVLALSTTAAVAEELLFRGVLYAFLARYLGFVAGAVLQALAFGAIHIGYLDPWFVVGATSFGLFQAFVSVRWGLVVAVAIHAQVNVVIVGWSGRGSVQANEVLVVGTLTFNLATLAVVWLASRRASADSGRARSAVTVVAGR